MSREYISSNRFGIGRAGAKANKLEPFKYQRYLFEKIPFAEGEVEYKAPLPMNLNMEQVLPDRLTGVILADTKGAIWLFQIVKIFSRNPVSEWSILNY